MLPRCVDPGASDDASLCLPPDARDRWMRLRDNPATCRSPRPLGWCQDGWDRRRTAVNKPARWESALNPDPQGCLQETHLRAALPFCLTEETAAFPPRGEARAVVGEAGCAYSCMQLYPFREHSSVLAYRATASRSEITRPSLLEKRAAWWHSRFW